MPVKVTYPGVYIQERASGIHAVSGVATSIAAFVGYTARGPDQVAKHILGFSDFERIYGGLAADSELSYAVQQFFANGGTEGYVVRVPRTGALGAIIALRDAAVSGVLSLDFSTLSTGTWSSNVVIDVDYEKASTAQSFNLTFTDLGTGNSETFANVTMDATKSNYVLTVVNDPDNGSAIFKVAADAAKGGRPAETGTVGAKVAFANLKASFGGGLTADKNYTLKLTADVPASLTSGVTATFLAQGDPIPTDVMSACRVLERAINSALRTAQAGASVTCRPRTTPGSTSPDSIRVTAQFPPDVVSTAVDAALTFSAGTNDAAAPLGLTGAGASVNVARYWIGGSRTVGVDKLAEKEVQLPKDGDSLPGNTALISGLAALDQVDLFNILCIPDATRANPGNPAQLDPNPGTDQIDPNAIFAAAMTVCLQRRAFLIVDPPPYVTDVDGAAAWKFTGLTVHDKNGAAYWPRPRLPDPLNGMQLRSFAPCGVIAGVYARIDADRGVWKAPAGIEAQLTGVQQLTVKLTDADNGVLNPLGLNALRNLPIYGMVSWGARTLVGADGDDQDWKYVPVRRLALYLEESLFRGLKWAVFEPNDEPLWAQIRLNVGSFLNGIFRQGGFAGKTPQDAYFVKCDKETTTPADQALGVVNILIGFAPLQPAEFVVITVQQIAGQTAI